jgi:hypothetical protein
MSFEIKWVKSWEEYPTLLLLSRKRPRDKEASSHAAHLRSENGHANKTVTGSAEFAVDPERTDEVEVTVSPRKNDVVLCKVNDLQRMLQQGYVHKS